MIDKLVDECTETVEEVKPTIKTLAENENSYKFSSCTVLFWIFFTNNIGGIGAYFVHFYWYLIKDALHVDFNTRTQIDFYWTYKWDKPDKLTLNIKLISFTKIKLI